MNVQNCAKKHIISFKSCILPLIYGQNIISDYNNFLSCHNIKLGKIDLITIKPFPVLYIYIYNIEHKGACKDYKLF